MLTFNFNRGGGGQISTLKFDSKYSYLLYLFDFKVKTKESTYNVYVFLSGDGVNSEH